MAAIKEILQEVMTGYAVKAVNGYSVLTRNADDTLFTIVYIGDVNGERIIDTGLIARIEDDHIIIEHDANSKPLVYALLQAGIPREKIILAYATNEREAAL